MKEITIKRPNWNLVIAGIFFVIGIFFLGRASEQAHIPDLAGVSCYMQGGKWDAEGTFPDHEPGICRVACLQLGANHTSCRILTRDDL